MGAKELAATQRNTRTWIEEDDALEASHLDSVYVEVVQPVRHLVEHSLEDTTNFWILHLVALARETVSEENSVRLGPVSCCQVQHAVLAPAHLQKLDLVIQAETDKSRNAFGPLDHLQERRSDAFEQVLKLNTSFARFDLFGWPL